MKINVTYLKSLGACDKGLADFRSAFPRGLTVKPGARLTPRTAERLASLARHIGWFLEESDLVSADAAYAYDTAVSIALHSFRAAREVAEDKYGLCTDDYDVAYPALWAEYNRARVRAFWRALGGVA